MTTQRTLRWLFTLNNPTIDGDEIWTIIEALDVDRACWQLELSPSGTPHFQGYICFKNRKEDKYVWKLFDGKANWIRATGSCAHNLAYCSKDDTRIGTEKWIIGRPEEFISTNGIKPGRRSDWNDIRDLIQNGATASQISESHPMQFATCQRGILALIAVRDHALANKYREVSVLVRWGLTGTGKTSSVYDDYGFENVYKLDPAGTLWFDGYEGQSVLLIDDFTGWIKYTTLLTLLDRYPYRCQVKSSYCWALWTTVVITSNIEPRSWYQLFNADPDRYNALRRRIKTITHYNAPLVPAPILIE